MVISIAGEKGYLSEPLYKQDHERRIKGLGPSYEFSATHINKYTDLFMHLRTELGHAQIILSEDQRQLALKWSVTPLTQELEPMKSDLQKKLTQK